jgi:agmatine/peptidylarginine deiminase
VHLAFNAANADFVSAMLERLLPLVPVFVTPCRDASEEQFNSLLESRGIPHQGIRFLNLRHDWFWARDFGPVAVEMPDGRPAFLDFRYPQTRVLDDGLPSALAATFDVPVYRVPVALEGGVFMTNGEGLCVTTPTLAVANADVTFPDLVETIGRVLGCRRLVFLESPRGESTGHVDMFAKFTAPDAVLVSAFDAGIEPDEAARMDRNARLLEALRLGDGGSLRVVRVPAPAPEDGVYRSYTNSLIINGTAIVPVYGRASGEEAAVRDAYRRALPDGWRLSTVDASTAIDLGGAVHCAGLELRIARRDH